MDFNYNVSDSDGTVSNVTLEVFRNGNLQKEETFSYGSSSVEDTQTDWFTPTETGNYTVYFTAVDDQGASTTEWLNRSLGNSAPQVSVSEPVGTKWSYEQSVEFSVDASDSYPGENVSCDISRDGQVYEEVFFREGVNSSSGFSGSVSSGLGGHTLEVACQDQDGNTDTANETYTVDDFQVNSVSSPAWTYETENTSFDTEVKTGSMINSVNFELFYDGSQAAEKDPVNNGINNHSTTLYHEPLLTQSNASSRDWYFSYRLNRSRYNGSGYDIIVENSSTQQQDIWYAYHSPEITNTKNRAIEDESFNASTTFTDELLTVKADTTCQTGFNGSSQTGCNVEYDAPLLNNTASATETVSGSTVFSFKDSSREMQSSTDSIDVYRKILTDCSTQKYGVTGEQALNYTLINEENQSQNLKGTLEYNYDVTHHGDHTRNYAFEKVGVESAGLCLYPEWTEYEITGPLQYESSSDVNDIEKNFRDRSYGLYNYSIDNTSETIDLYLLSDDYSTAVYFQVDDSSGQAVSGATIKVMRYFIGSNSYITVAKSETDSNGVATSHIRINEIYYKYVISKDGEVLMETDRQIFTCRTKPCTKTFSVDPDIQSPRYQTRQGYSYNCGVNTDSSGNATGYQCTVDHESGVIGEAQLHVEKKDTIGWENVCKIRAASSASSLVCEFNESVTGNVYNYRLTAEKNGYTYELTSGELDYSEGMFGENAEVVALSMFLTLTMMGLISPSASVLFSTAGILASWWLGLITVTMSAAASLIAVALIIVLTGRS